MKFSTGTIVTIVVVLLFYLRLIILQRQKVRLGRMQYSAADQARKKKKKTEDEPLAVRWGALGVRVRNWWLVGGGLVLIVAGTVIAGTHILSPSLTSAWWVPLNIGVVLLAVGVK